MADYHIQHKQNKKEKLKLLYFKNIRSEMAHDNVLKQNHKAIT